MTVLHVGTRKWSVKNLTALRLPCFILIICTDKGQKNSWGNRWMKSKYDNHVVYDR